ncbi:MAG TPA: flagellar biosynthesis anti-sigma factor FlgM [Candidatus Binatia bacterium]|nr:flagellar biosynthesis anti-sigma factor FlgM [Candidatus Binatia bacterium]
MRIDLTASSLPELERSGNSPAAKAGRQVSDRTMVPGDDEAHLSVGSDAVENLKAQLSSVSEVRQQRVEGLRRAIADGSFQISPREIAGAMLADDVRMPRK